MIATLEGEVGELQPESLVLHIGGVGLRVYVPAPLRDRVHPGERIFLHTHLVVREDLLSLYGFENRESLEFFNLLLGVNGIGPRMALAILSTLSTDAIRRAVVSEQSEIFARVPGVGKRTAQKILLHLQGRITGEGLPAQASAVTEVEAELIGALTALGYSIIEAQTAVQAIPHDAPEDVETRLRIALQYFSS
jgi:Holliday junction DNA helicase RuvA